ASPSWWPRPSRSAWADHRIAVVGEAPEKGFPGPSPSTAVDRDRLDRRTTLVPQRQHPADGERDDRAEQRVPLPCDPYLADHVPLHPDEEGVDRDRDDEGDVRIDRAGTLVDDA